MRTVLVLAALVSACVASGPNFYFDPSTILNCMGQNPHAGRPGQPNSIPEDTPIIAFQPGEPGSVYLPVTSGFKSPVTGPLPRYIENLLRRSLRPDERVTFVGEHFPTRPPIVPGSILPSLAPFSSGAIPGGVGTTVAPPKDYRELIRNVLRRIVVHPNDIEPITTIVGRLTDRCIVRARWTKLPDGQFFPQWISGAYCRPDNCSVPAGLTCNPVLIDDVLIPVDIFRWDCCWSIVNRQWRWECGWRKVTILLFGQCACSCYDVMKYPFSHTGRLPGGYSAHIQNLNT